MRRVTFFRRFSVPSKRAPLVKHRKCGANDPERSPDTDRLFTESLALFEDKNFSGALEKLEEALRVDTRDERLYAARASCLEHVGRGDEALEDLLRVTQLRPDFPPGHVAYADALKRMNRLDEAEEVIDRLMSVAAPLAAAFVCKGEILAARGKWSAAEIAFRAALKKDPEDRPAISGMAMALLQQGKNADAERLLEKSLQLSSSTSGSATGTREDDASSAEDWALLGAVRYEVGKYTESVDAFSRAISLSGRLEFRMQRAAANLQLKKAVEAKDDLLKLRSAGTAKEIVQVSDLLLASAHLLLEEWRAAIPLFAAWIQNVGSRSPPKQLRQVMLMHALCLARTGDRQEARKWVAQAKSIKEPVDEEYAKELKKVEAALLSEDTDGKNVTKRKD